MILARIAGGLGNQMFQYAAARRLADRHGGELRLDLTWYEREEPLIPASRPYLLDLLPIRARPATLAAAAAAEVDMWGLWPEQIPAVGDLRLVLEEGPAFDPRLLAAPEDVYLVGYWQSERYFGDAGDLIRSELTPPLPAATGQAELASHVAAVESVSVHVRRGDYAEQPATLHGVLPVAYYRAAAELMESRVSRRCEYFVFSDDPDWCRSNLDPPRWTVVDFEGGSPVSDLSLMTLCKHHIVANSSFSWWGAWLGRDPDKVVVAPRRWARERRVESPDRVPASWLRI